MHKKIVIIFITALSLLTTISAHAASTYTSSDVSAHNSTTNCWVIYDNGVYDLTNYLRQHDRYLDIRSWCGKDMTEDFEDKAGQGQDHKSSSYSLLASYKIGELSSGTSITASTVSTSQSANTSATPTSSTETAKNPYNFWAPFLITLITFGITLALKIPKPLFNLFWNTILGLSLIPSAVFGFYLILRYSIPSLNSDFDLLYWHVEGSIIFATLCILHLVLRLKQFFAPTKLLNK